MEYIYVTVHSLSESSINLNIYFDNEQCAEDVAKSDGKIAFPILRMKDSSIRERNDKFIDGLMINPVKRKEFMKSVQDIRVSRSARLSGSRN
jgi:hypothetical protein